MVEFCPDFGNVVDAARNVAAGRVPLYEHIISIEIIERIIGKEFGGLFNSKYPKDVRSFFGEYCSFFKRMGYDTVSWELCVGPIMPGSGALGGHQPGVIQSREDYDKYPWESIEDLYFDAYSRHFEALRDEMPEGMKAIGGVGNGVFECVQEVVGYESLCLMMLDDPELYAELFGKIGDVLGDIWERFLKEFGDIYAVCRFGDDLGFKSSTLLAPGDIGRLVIPQYKKIVELVHGYDKPFLLHSCGCMGASIGVAHGVSKAGIAQKNVAVIGDSTFFHTGMPALLNVAYNQSNTVVIVMDNRTTAMTGHQQNPGTGKTLMEQPTYAVEFEALVRAMGIQRVHTVDAYRLADVEAALRDCLEADGPAVVIARRECALLPVARKQWMTLAVDEERCNGCGLCFRVACPAIAKSDRLDDKTQRAKARIDPLLCTGCEVCAQVCVRRAIAFREEMEGEEVQFAR